VKKIIFLLVLGLATTSWSLDYGDSFLQYRNQIKRKLGHDTASVEPNDSIYNYMIREAVIKVMPIIRAGKKSFSFVTTYRSNSYALDTTVNGVFSLYWSKNDSIKTLIKAPMEEWYKLMKSDETILSGKKGYQSRPTYWDYRDSTVILFPTPTRSGDTIRYDAYIKVIGIGEDDNLSSIPQKYRVVIVEYATYLMAQILQHPNVTTYKKDFSESVAILTNRGANVTVSDK